MTRDLLLEIGVEELPASFVTNAIQALPELMAGELRQLRLAHRGLSVYGTPRRLGVLVDAVAESQPDLDEQVLGPPARVAFDGDGKPTRAAESFASKIGCPIESLTRTMTDRGEYVAGHRKESGAAARDLLPLALARVCAGIPFRKSMRWGNGDSAFGRPVRWLLALFGEEPLEFTYADIKATDTTYGHRFLSPDAIELRDPAHYVPVLREHHVIVDVAERRREMLERLRNAASEVGGTLVEDAFLVEENLHLVEEPHVVAGSFEPRFLTLPERVILEVAKEQQRYFGVRDRAGKLLPRYLAVVGTALRPDNIRLGNDRVMRARLADAKFFYDEDVKAPLAERRPALDGIVFQKRLGTVGDKMRRVEELVGELGRTLGLAERVVATAREGAALAKCDLVTLMVGELPELQGEMGRAYALAQGIDAATAAIISEHYQPRGADDPPAASDGGALVAIADRLDTLTGCFAIGLIPSGTADPLALRRAAIGFLRTLLAKRWELSISEALELAYARYDATKLDLNARETCDKLAGFLRHRLRGVLGEPADVVDACIAASSDRPYDVALRVAALAAIDPEVRASAGEVFKRAANIAKDAPDGEPVMPKQVQKEVHPSEQRLFDEYERLKQRLAGSQKDRDYRAALSAISGFAPTLARFFVDVYVMVDDLPLRHNRLRLMREIHRTGSALANFNLLAKRTED